MAKKTEKLWSFFTKNPTADMADKKHPKVTCQISVDFVKIIAPVETRWNSSLMMMRSILQLRPALERVREDFSKATDAKLRGAIPTTEEFDQVIFV